MTCREYPRFTWQARAAAKRADTLSRIPLQWRLSSADLARARRQRVLCGTFIESFLTARETDIVKTDSVPLTAALARGELTAVEVTEAFCKVAALAHQMNPCLHEIFFDKALIRARKLDEHFRRSGGKTVGVLHGLPVSLKDQMHVKGIDTTMGYVGWIGRQMGAAAPDNGAESELVRELLACGAVLFCKTACPQTLMWPETITNIYGETRNPRNMLLGCGGSSGGEAVLHALRGSTLGFGSDIGGSVRYPAAFCGTYSLKPTPERLSYKDCANTCPGETVYKSTLGPMATSLQGLELGMRATLGTEPWLRDPDVMPMPWREHIARQLMEKVDKGSGRVKRGERGLKFAFMFDNGVLRLHPPVERGMRMVHEAITRAGHTAVEYDGPEPQKIEDGQWRIINSDGGKHIHEQLTLSGEPLITSGLERDWGKDGPKQPLSLAEFQDVTLTALANEHAMSDWWNATGNKDGQPIDGIITPLAATAASLPGKYSHGFPASGMVNACNYAAVVFPVTAADKAVDVLDQGYVPRNDCDKFHWENSGTEPFHFNGLTVGPTPPNHG